MASTQTEPAISGAANGIPTGAKRGAALEKLAALGGEAFVGVLEELSRSGVPTKPAPLFLPPTPEAQEEAVTPAAGDVLAALIESLRAEPVTGEDAPAHILEADAAMSGPAAPASPIPAPLAQAIAGIAAALPQQVDAQPETGMQNASDIPPRPPGTPTAPSLEAAAPEGPAGPPSGKPGPIFPGLIDGELVAVDRVPSTLAFPADAAGRPAASAAKPLDLAVSVVREETHFAPISPLGAPMQQISDAVTVALEDGARLQLPTHAVEDTREPLRVLHIKLEPAELGTIQAKLFLAGDKVRVEIETQRAETAEVLSGQKDMLLRGLERSGYGAEEVSVRLAPAETSVASVSVPDAGNRAGGQGAGGQSMGGGPGEGAAGRQQERGHSGNGGTWLGQGRDDADDLVDRGRPDGTYV